MCGFFQTTYKTEDKGLLLEFSSREVIHQKKYKRHNILTKLLTSQFLGGSSFSDWGFHCAGVRAFLMESAWICGICSTSAALTNL